MANFKFQILNKEGNARNGVIETKMIITGGFLRARSCFTDL